MNISEQLETLASGPDYLEKVVVTRPFLKAVLAKLSELQKAASTKHVCPSCEILTPEFQIPERDDGPHAARLFANIMRVTGGMK